MVPRSGQVCGPDIACGSTKPISISQHEDPVPMNNACGSAPFIRAARRSDLAAIANLQLASWRDAYKSFLPPSYLRDRAEQDVRAYWDRCRIRPEDLLLVAFDTQDEERMVGFIAVWCRPNPFIDNLHCDPTETGKGIGKTLMAAAFKQLLLRKKRTVALSVITENVRARDFYLRLGGNPLKRQKEEIFGNPVNVDIIVWNDIDTMGNW
ncbi:GNAT family N-acetyltransferase [Cohaesibacter sp. CAU 1516]|nr:GNAT family N-acetyltransferase [Cohaesibacter sp. CAU 1516]